MNPRSREVERRRRLLTRALPLIFIAIVAFVFGAMAGTPSSPEKEVAERFVRAWEGDEFAAMYKELNPASRRKIELNDFVSAYRAAENVATLRSLEADSPGDTSSHDGETVVPVPVRATTAAFGSVEADLPLPFADGGVNWDESLVFPGLRKGEHLESQVEL